MDRYTQGKCNLAFKKRDGWHNCRAPRNPAKAKDHRHDTSAGPPEVGDIVAKRRWPTGYDELGKVKAVTKDGKVELDDGTIV